MVSMTDYRTRRGVLLLVVLSVLTLFLMLGAAYVAVASRARKASRAFADNVVAGTAGGMTQERVLDDAFLSVARGTLANTGTGGLVDFIGTGSSGGNDLLGDKYGKNTAKGRVSSAARADGSSAVLQLTCSVTSGSVAQAVSEYPGRVVTLALPGLSVSARIIGATGAANAPTLFIAGGPTVTGETLSDTRINAAIAKVSSASVTTLIINGREFDDSGENEPYDGYDNENPLLTRSGSDVATTGTAVMYRGKTLAVDNDGDGVEDSAFLDIGLQPVLGTNGQLVYPRAAILVLDLDGRLNVNAHGSATDAQTVGKYPTFNPAPTLSATTVPLYQLPRGFASGPADVSLSRSLVFSSTNTTNLTEAQIVQDATYSLAGVTTSGTSGNDALIPSREVPEIGAVEGRFGDRGTQGTLSMGGGLVAPGIGNCNDENSGPADQWRASVDVANNCVSRRYVDAPGRFGSPWDLKGRMRIWADEFGQPVYFKPSWSTAGTPDDDVVDDPYEVNLTRLGSRAAYGAAPAGATPPDNLFTPAELEGLLRYHDPDSLKLPRRLVAISGSNASANRLRLTTESWDTPAVTGAAWRTVIGGTTASDAFAPLLAASGLSAPNRPFDAFSPETIMGHKLDINRPFHDTQFDEPNDATGVARRQAFARHLYCLMMAVADANGLFTSATPTNRAYLARQMAQYAVNVVDYRDGDSVMTRFQYDPSFAPPGTTPWSPGPDDYVWGCERPELLITETLAWHDRQTDDDSVGGKVTDANNADDDFDQDRRPRGAFFVELYSPWKSRTAHLSSGTAVIRSGSGTRGDPVPASLRASGTHGFDVSDGGPVADSTITLSKTVGGFPVWRLVSVRGEVQGGTAISGSTHNLQDPSAPGSPAVVDRVFYLGNLTGAGTALRNPSDPKDGTPGAVFWTTGSASAEPSQSQYVVVGTDGLGFEHDTAAFTPSGTLPYEDTVHLRFDGASTLTGTRQPATLSEPLATTAITASSKDPYELVATAVDGGNQNKFTPDDSARPHLYSPSTNLQRPTDQPLDRVSGIPGISEPFLTSGGVLPAGKPLLMFNGTHENFAVLHLQRLADPGKPWNASSNPYVTVDSLPVDLTVMNNGSFGGAVSNQDEPGVTGATPLDWLTTQKAYRYKTVQRGGQNAPAGTSPVERDIWSRRVNEAGTTLASGTAVLSAPYPFTTGSISPRNAGTSAITINPGSSSTLKPVSPTPTLTGTTDHTLREHTSQTERDSRPIRFERAANTPPRFPWLAWPNQPFGSVVDLALVPVGSPFELTGRHSTNAATSPSPKWFHLSRFFEAVVPESPWSEIAGRSPNPKANLFDFVHVPSPYVSIYTTVPSTTSSNTQALARLGLDVFPINQISNFREPGRVNVNTIPDRRVWRALFGAVAANGIPGDPVNFDDPAKLIPTGEADARDQLPGWSVDTYSRTASGTSSGSGSNSGGADSGGATRVTGMIDFFRNIPARGANAPSNAVPNRQPSEGGFRDRFVSEDTNGNGVPDAGEDSNGNGSLDINAHRDTDLHAYFRYQTMRQLSNVTTTRSHVFGVWITIAYMDGPSPTAAEVQPIARNRAFYIFDRSIPVAYEQGKDHNVRDAILVRRIIQ